MHVAKGLVDQVQVEVVDCRRRSDCSMARWVRSKPASCTHSLVVTNSSRAGTPLARSPRADGLLVHVGGGRVDQPVANRDRLDDAALALADVGDLETPKPTIGIRSPLFKTTWSMSVCIRGLTMGGV